MASMEFDTTAAPDPDNFDPLPAGSYEVEIVESDVVAARSGNGTMLKITMAVIGGEYAGRRIWDNINFQHVNETAQRIGQQRVKSICNAIGFEGVLEDSTQLHGVSFMCRISLENDAERGPQNRVKSYSAANQQQSAPPPKPVAPAPRPATPQSRPAPAAPAGNRPAPAFMNRKAG